MGSRRRKPATGVLLTLASARAFAAATRALRQDAISPRAFAVLELVQEHPRPQRELATILELDPSRIVSLVDALEAAGFVERRRSERDRRSRVVVATAAGARAYPRIRRAVDEAIDSSLGNLTTEERSAFDELLRRVVGDAGVIHEPALAREVPTARDGGDDGAVQPGSA